MATFPAYSAFIGAVLYVQVELLKLLLQITKLYLVILALMIGLVAVIFLTTELPKLIATL